MADQEFKFPDEVEDKPVAAVEPEIEIEVVDDTPVKDRGRSAAAENPEPDEEELSSYSDRVKKRINILQKAYHDERRLKEQADRERQEAITYATNIVEKNKTKRNDKTAGFTTFFCGNSKNQTKNSKSQTGKRQSEF